MSDADRAFGRLGDFVWARFRLVGVPSARAAAIQWFRDPKSVWVGDGSRCSLTELLLQVSAAGLRQSTERPDPEVVAMTAASVGQVGRVLDAPDNHRLALLLVVVDGLAIDEAARVLSMTSTAVQFALNDVEDDLDALATPDPAGSLESGHLNTIQLHGFALESLDSLQMQQHEQHLASCSRCFARFDAWSRNREAFDALPRPRPVQQRSPLLPLVGLGCGLLTITMALGAVAAFTAFTVEERIEDARWDGSPAEVEARTLDGPVDHTTAGTLVQIWYDPGNARHVGFAWGKHGQLWEMLAVMPAGSGEGMRQAPVEVEAVAGELTLWVLLSERPMSETGVREALSRGRADIVVAAVTVNVGE